MPVFSVVLLLACVCLDSFASAKQDSLPTSQHVLGKRHVDDAFNGEKLQLGGSSFFVPLKEVDGAGLHVDMRHKDHQVVIDGSHQNNAGMYVQLVTRDNRPRLIMTKRDSGTHVLRFTINEIIEYSDDNGKVGYQPGEDTVMRACLDNSVRSGIPLWVPYRHTTSTVQNREIHSFETELTTCDEFVTKVSYAVDISAIDLMTAVGISSNAVKFSLELTGIDNRSVNATGIAISLLIEETATVTWHPIAFDGGRRVIDLEATSTTGHHQDLMSVQRVWLSTTEKVNDLSLELTMSQPNKDPIVTQAERDSIFESYESNTSHRPTISLTTAIICSLLVLAFSFMV